jgi:hypothetical protein
MSSSYTRTSGVLLSSDSKTVMEVVSRQPSRIHTDALLESLRQLQLG